MRLAARCAEKRWGVFEAQDAVDARKGALLTRLVTCKNIKEAFDGHRGLPLESVHYDKGSIADLLKQETHRLAFEVDVELSDAVVQETEQRIRDLRKRLDEPNGGLTEKARVTERLLRYQVELEIEPKSGVMRVMNERRLSDAPCPRNST